MREGSRAAHIGACTYLGLLFFQQGLPEGALFYERGR